MKVRLIVPCILCVASALLSCTSSEDRVIAQVGDMEITVGMIKNEYLAISEHARPELETIEQKEAFARDVAIKELIRREAETAGFGELPAVRQARESAIQTKAWQAFYEGEIKRQIQISEAEMRDLYEKQRVVCHLAWIFMRSRGVAEEALRKIRAGRDFGDIALLYSIDPSRTEKGDIGFRPMGLMPDEVEARIAAMSPGEVSEVLPYEGYFTVIKVFECQEQEQMDFETSKVGLESMLMTRKITRKQLAMAAEYREKYNVSYNDDVIKLIAARTREAHPTEKTPRGQIPEFSDDELGLIASSYDGGEWTVGKYVERIRGMRDFGRPSYGTDAEAIRSVLRDYMMGELWLVEARALGYADRDDVIRAGDRAHEEAMITAFHDSLVKDVTVDEAELREFYDQNRDQLLSEPTYRLAIIVLENKAEADEVYEELERGADFASLARERSIDPRTRRRDGEITELFLDRNLRQFPDVYDVVYQMEDGDYAGPMLLPPGWGPEGDMVLKLVHKEEARPLEFEEIEPTLSPRVLELERDKVFGEWISAKIEEMEVSLNPDALASVDFSSL